MTSRGWHSPSFTKVGAAMMDSTPLDGALAAVRRGWHIFPLLEGGKEPHPGFSWTRLASNSEAQVLAWEAMYPNSNWGVHCGLSGLAVLDIDVKRGAPGPDSLLELELEHGSLPPTFTIRTPSGGWHRYYQGASRSRNGFLPGLDMKSGIEGRSSGYTLLPGSVIDGKKYEVTDGRELADLPEWLPAVVTAKPEKTLDTMPEGGGTTSYGQKALELEVGRVAVAEQGKRNDALNKASFALGQLVAGGEVDEGTAVAALRRAAKAAGLPRDETEATIASGLAAGRKEPRSARPREFEEDDNLGGPDLGSSAELRPVEFVVDGFLGAGIVYLGGAHGLGKSTCLAALLGLITGELPESFESGISVTLKRTVVVFSEDPDQFQRCRHALIRHHGLVENGRFILKRAQRRPPDLIGRIVASLTRQHTIPGPNGYALRPVVVYDTSNANFEIESEDSSQEVGRVYAGIKESAPGANVWLCGHVSKVLLRADLDSLTGRGSGAWEADANGTAFFFRDDDSGEDVRFLGVKKTRFEPAYREIQFRTSTDSVTIPTPWGQDQTIALRHGVPSRSSKTQREEAREAKKQEKALSKLTEAEHAVIGLLKGMLEPISQAELVRQARAMGIGRDHARSAIASLIEAGTIDPNREIRAGALTRNNGLALVGGESW